LDQGWLLLCSPAVKAKRAECRTDDICAGAHHKRSTRKAAQDQDTNLGGSSNQSGLASKGRAAFPPLTVLPMYCSKDGQKTLTLRWS